MLGGNDIDYFVLVFEKITLYVNTSRDNMLSILGFSVENNNSVYTTLYHEEFKKLMHEAVDIRSFLEKQLIKKAWSEVEAFCTQKPQKDFFKTDFWGNVSREAGIKPEPDCTWNPQYKGILQCEVQMRMKMSLYQKDKYATYNFLKQEFNAHEDPLHYAKLYFGNDYIFAITECWMEKGLMPPAYVEIAAINRFLNGAKTAKLVMKDGSEYCCQSKYNTLKANAFLDFRENEYIISKDIKTTSGTQDIAGLRHGSRKLSINPEPLLLITENK